MSANNMRRKGAMRRAAVLIARLGDGWESACYRSEGGGQGCWVPVVVNYARGLRVVEDLDTPAAVRYSATFTAVDSHLDHMRDDLHVLTDPSGYGWGRASYVGRGPTPETAIEKLVTQSRAREEEVHAAVMAILEAAE